jgi:hypothetical protein
MSILDVLSPYKLLIEVAVVGSLVLCAGVEFHGFLEHERDIGRNEVRAEYAQKLAEAKDAAKVREDELRAQRDDAINKGNDREQTIRSLASANGAAAAGLRDTANSISNRLPSLTADALRSIASAYGDVLTECQSRRGEVAEIAERLNSEKMTLIQSWPKNAEVAK